MAKTIIKCTFLRDGKKITEERLANEFGFGISFTGCEDLISIELPDSVWNIETSAFKGCTNLTSITAKGVSHIGNWAFSGCKNLQEVNFTLEKIKWVGNGPFEDCKKMPQDVFERCAHVAWFLRNMDPGYDDLWD